MKSDDLSSFLASTPAADTSLPDFGWHQGEVVAWDSQAGTNKIRVAGTVLDDLAVLTSAGSVSLEAGAAVGVLRYRTSYFVVGRVVLPGSGLVQPQSPVVMYPQFRPNGVAGTSGNWGVNAGVLTSWEGRARPNQPYIEIDGVWGVSSGAGSVTYEVKLGGTSYGSQVFTGLSVSRLGPFDIRDRIGQDWLKVEVAITASSGTGERAFSVLGAYFRQA